MDQLPIFTDRRSVRVLIVDDDRHVVDVLTRRLRRHERGYDVRVCPTSEVKHADLALDSMDVILVGITRDRDGFSPLRWLARRVSDTAIVAIQHLDAEPNVDLVVTGAQDVLPLRDVTTMRLDRVIRTAMARKRAESATLASALTDPVTSMPSRSWMLQRLEMAVAHAPQCGGGWQVAVLFVDLDRFKVVNDTLGHGTGDVLLRMVADRLKSVVRLHDPITRFGGDEFVILLEGLSIESLAHRIALRALATLQAPFVIDGHTVSVFASVGLAVLRDGETADDLLHHADQALYRAKRLGRNRLEVFDDELRQWSDSQHDLAAALEADLHAGRLELERRAIWDLGSTRCTGSLVSARWENVASRTELVDLAVRHGLGRELGQWLVERAIKELRSGHEPAHQVVVDAPPALVSQPAFVDWLAELIDRHRVDPSRLSLAVSERELADADLVRPVLDGLNRLGVSMVLSDFGSGVSSLSLFSSMHVDEVFLSADLVAGIAQDPTRQVVVDSLLRIAETVGQRVTALGPNSVEDVATLASLRCETVIAAAEFVHPPAPRLFDLDSSSGAESAPIHPLHPATRPVAVDLSAADADADSEAVASSGAEQRVALRVIDGYRDEADRVRHLSVAESD